MEATNNLDIVWKTEKKSHTYLHLQRFVRDKFQTSIFDNTFDHLHVDNILNYIHGKLDKNLRNENLPNIQKFLRNKNMKNFMYVSMTPNLVCKITHASGEVIYISGFDADWNTRTYKYDDVETILTIEIMDESSVNRNHIKRFPTIHK